MKNRLLYLIPLLSIKLLSVEAQSDLPLENAEFEIRVIADKLSDPWELTNGPDNHLWITESKGYRVLRIDPVSGKKQLIADLSKERTFPRYDKIPDRNGRSIPWPQGGLMGMALHPSLLKSKPFVYLTYIYDYKGNPGNVDGGVNGGGHKFLQRIVRYTYDFEEEKLVQPIILCDTIPASNDHNGGRLLIAPVNGKPYLFFSTGDMGAGQFSNGARQNKAQNQNSYEGKILRFNLEADGDNVEENQWIPNDNPFNGSWQNAVWTIGHRNPQGLAFADIDGEKIYSVEHGPYSDDEINLVEKGANYGHPLVIGYDDGNYNGLAASVSNKEEYPGIWNTSYPLIKDEKQNARTVGSTYRNPITSFYPTGNNLLSELYTNIQKGHKQEWQSFAPSSVEVYQSDAIPGWKNSLLIPTLKGARLIRVQLDNKGKVANSTVYEYVRGNVRYRDLAISNDGLKLYVAVDSALVSSGPSKEDPKQASYRGSVIELTYKIPSDQTSHATKPETAKLINAKRKEEE
ncbi:PQQ-dependent sugar dehydrogenase [Arcticibacter sp.]|uniref:PQQ-dependent sugar dehydrogenase n=1 Tax=Arcticibacter sp. TaxID=1872630 RepID=UPI00389022CC